MLQTIKTKLPPMSGFAFDQRTVTLAIAALAAAASIGIGIYIWSEPSSYRPLYGAGEAYRAAEVIQVLEAEAVPYRLHPQSGQVLVRDDQLASARMQLSARGVEVAVPPGYELFDREDPLGTSQFVQDVRLKRSLEGELARTIMSLRGVDQARVHVAREESRSFVVGRREPAKASVMLQLVPGHKLGEEQVTAIVNLVSNSVPKLAPADVSVVDQYGTLLSRGLGDSGASQRSAKVVEDYRNSAIGNVEQVLAPVIGAGNFRVSITPDFDLSQREETTQTYASDPRIRNETVRSESALDRLALGVPGSLSNLPVQRPQGQQNGGDGENRGATSLREESVRQLDYGQSVMHVRHAPFELRQQSVAVVLNAQSGPEGGWTPELREEVLAMVRNAVGFNGARGDQLSLSVLPFAPPADAVAAAWWENPAIREYARLAGLLLIAVLVLLLVVRPAIRMATAKREAEREITDLEQVVDDSGPSDLMPHPRLARPGEHAALTVLSELSPLSEIRLPAPDSGLELQVEHLRMLARTEPERVSEVLKHWIGRNDHDLNPA
ncbi:flagellar basal-body MS-ring/collar protein FliF [Parazoarcus communis]|uniref:Flagellar M-ring protein n=1 Tax=Parazoarcus communis SWub3 = DSM 12120 TaxID=1121029 RepID=A0A323V9L0_9RHOO|nr:flagellar basal-body MS-ring/collar protein FliF [Parazoarcus communis]NMG69061.1 flagellar M-ring protein FliF [Parazoarcus communis SWub3 = DSM 12120]PZA16918.1 flagellar M-ring protein FliF [Azoarcus communis] [Parazoarcus communis SWub3 = DSM 12120]